MAPCVRKEGSSQGGEEAKLKRSTQLLEEELSQQREATLKAQELVVEREQEVERLQQTLLQTAAVKDKQSRAVAGEYMRLDALDAEWSKSEQELVEARSLAVDLTTQLHAIKDSLQVKIQEALLVVRGECRGREKAGLERRREERQRLQQQCAATLAHARGLLEEARAREHLRQAELRSACKNLSLARIGRAGQKWHAERSSQLYREKRTRELAEEMQRLQQQSITMAQEISDREVAMRNFAQEEADLDALMQKRRASHKANQEAEIAILEKRIAEAEERLKRQPKNYAVTEMQDPLTEKEKAFLAAKALAGHGCQAFAGATKRADIRSQVMAPILASEQAERPGSRQMGACRLHKVPSPTLEGELRALEDQMSLIRNSNSWHKEEDDDAALFAAIQDLTLADSSSLKKVAAGGKSPAGSAVHAARAARDDAFFAPLFAGDTNEEFLAKVV